MSATIKSATSPPPPSNSAPHPGPDSAPQESAPAGQPHQLSPENIQAIARALADPRRFAILQQIAASENLMCSHLDAQESISPATISHHLRELQEAGLIDARRNGRQMCLKLRRPVWNAYLHHLQQL